MKHHTLATVAGSVLALLAASPQVAPAAEAIRDDALLYGAVMDSKCEETSYTLESAALAAWAAKFAVNTVVGFASSYLSQATAASTVTRAANAPGMLYRWDSRQKIWSSNGCVRFWYARQQGDALSTDAPSPYGVGPANSELQWKAITARWRELGFLEPPYLYGEIRLTMRDDDNAVILQPVVLFARKLPEAAGFFRKATDMTLALDLRGLTGDTAFATHTLQLPNLEGGPVLLRGKAATRGMSSAWAVAPAPPPAAPTTTSSTAVPVTALITFTSTTDGTLFAKTLASAFETQKDSLAEALTPATKAKKAEARSKELTEQEAAVTAAFDAEAAVLVAQSALNAATDEGAKPGLQLELRKVQYVADMKRQAAGLGLKYGVSGP